MNPQNLHAHEDRLLDFVYGELPVPEARAVEAHLQGCARCTQALDDIRGVRATMSQLSTEPAPDGGLESLLAYAQQSARRAAAGPAPRPSRWRRWLLPVVGLASVSTFGILALQQRNPDLTRPNLSQAAAEPEALRKTPRAPMAASPQTPAPQGAPMQAAPVEAAPDMVAGDEAPRRAEGWEKAGSGGGLDARIVRENEWKAKRDFGSSKERARSVSDKVATMKPAPSKKIALGALGSKDLDEEDALSAPEGRVADSQAPKLVPPRDSLRLGGTSAAYGGAADDAEQAQAEKAEPELLEAQPQTVASAGYASAGPAPAATPPPAPVVAAAPMPTAPSANRGAAPSTGRAEARAQETLAERSDFNAEPELLSTAKRKKGEAVSTSARPPPPRAQASAAEPRPSVAELSRRAREAFDDGDRAMEAGLLRSALAAGATGTERLGLLNRLCDAELAMGRQAAGVAACNQVLTEAPGSSAAQAARRRLSREPTSLEAPAKSADPAK